MTTTNTNNTPCYAETTGNGYWTCDVTGGCSGCRQIARDTEDFDQLREWSVERDIAATAAFQSILSAVDDA
jgi:hypothetical protein